MHLTPQQALDVLPEKYNHLAMDSDKKWYGYTTKPCTKGHHWWAVSDGGHADININIQSDKPWDQSLLSKESPSVI